MHAKNLCRFELITEHLNSILIIRTGKLGQQLQTIVTDKSQLQETYNCFIKVVI